MSEDKIKRAAWLLCSRIDGFIRKLPKEHQGIWSEGMLTAAKVEALNHHASHLVKLNIHQERLDHNKMLCWYGFILVKQAFGHEKSRFAPLNLIITEMNTLLEHSYSSTPGMRGFGMATACLSELRRMAERDGIDDDYAIGKNGLYTAFRSASEVKHRIYMRVLDGSITAA